MGQNAKTTGYWPVQILELSDIFVPVDVQLKHALTSTHNSHMQPFQRPFYSTGLHVPALAGYPLKDQDAQPGSCQCAEGK